MCSDAASLAAALSPRGNNVAAYLSPHVLAPRLYAYERVPSMEGGQIASVLASASVDKTPAGLRDHAILQLLVT